MFSPPVDVLERMFAVRIHLDECDMSNGPLRVIPGSHQFGRIPEKQIEEYVQQPSTTCVLPAGGVLLMRPLLLHASSPSQSPRHRRVIHIEYAAVELPAGLRWHSESKFESVPPLTRLPQPAS
jgi:ectoine hydroxylase-related dioxygenase (phytanoyl-CoA dioxygenase family)